MDQFAYPVFSSSDLDLDPMTLIYELDLDILKMYRQTKNEVSRSRFSEVRARTGQTDRQTWLNNYHAPFVGGYCRHWRILRVSWTSKKTNEWVLNTAGTTRELIDFVKARKLAYCGHIMRKQGNCLGKEISQGTMHGRRRRGRPRTAWINNISTWTKLTVEGSLRMTNDRD